MTDCKNKRPTIFLYTDGASSGNPGPGGFGIVLKCDGREKEISGGFARTTNNRMELLAVILGLESIKWKNADVEVFSDSSYVVKAVNEKWLEKWKLKGFAKVKNVDLWERFLNIYNCHNVTFHWLKGHAGHPENERCDALAVAAGAGAVARGVTLPEDTGYNNDTSLNLNI
ncbi:MAG: ribonuclease HI [Bacteroidales bacterium]